MQGYKLGEEITNEPPQKIKLNSQGNKQMPTIGALCMCKNESKRIHVTVGSVMDCCDVFILHDTGSEDDTIKISREICCKVDIVYPISD